MPEPVVVALGSNIEPQHHIPRALALLEARFGVLRRAPVYETEPVTRPGQDRYWNTAVLLTTGLRPAALRRRLRRMERTLGRRRTADRHAARTIDLDVIWRAGRVTDDDVAQRPFLQWLLADLAVGPHPAPALREKAPVRPPAGA